MRIRGLLLAILSLLYWALRRLIELLMLCGRADRAKEVAILVLRHELHVLIHGELVGLGIALSPSSVWNILRRHGIAPAPRRASLSWAQFLRQQAAGIVECDFLTAETLWLRRLQVLFFIELERRRVHLAGVTATRTALGRATGRNLIMAMGEHDRRPRFLIRDRDSKFTAAFDEVFRSEGIRVIRAPIRAPRAKAHAERWVGSVRRECLDWILILSRKHLERVLHEYVTHYNTHRPHRALEQRPPLLKRLPTPMYDDQYRVRRRDRVSGVVHEYKLAA